MNDRTDLASAIYLAMIASTKDAPFSLNAPRAAKEAFAAADAFLAEAAAQPDGSPTWPPVAAQ